MKPTIIKKWASGDRLYAAVRTSSYPAGVMHIYVDGTEYPIAEISPLVCDEYSVTRWVKRSEHFPEPIKGFNSPIK